MNSKLLSLLGAVGISLSASQSASAAMDFGDRNLNLEDSIAPSSLILEEISSDSDLQEDMAGNGVCFNSSCG